jgi:hypothetical protein
MSAIPTSTTAASASPASVSITTSTAKTGHFGKTGINLLLGLLQDIDELAGLFLI